MRQENGGTSMRTFSIESSEAVTGCWSSPYSCRHSASKWKLCIRAQSPKPVGHRHAQVQRLGGFGGGGAETAAATTSAGGLGFRDVGCRVLGSE